MKPSRNEERGGFSVQIVGETLPHSTPHFTSRRYRGTALIIAIVCLFLVTTVAALLARSGASRVQARRADVEREAALRHAESALEVARLSVERGLLKPGEKMRAEGLTVACAVAPGGFELATAVEAPLPPGVTSSSLQRLLRVRQTVRKQDNGSTPSDWQVTQETVGKKPLPTGNAGKR
jgi:Tfp pilus assembly protein PilX